MSHSATLPQSYTLLVELRGIVLGLWTNKKFSIKYPRVPYRLTGLLFRGVCAYPWQRSVSSFHIFCSNWYPNSWVLRGQGNWFNLLIEMHFGFKELVFGNWIIFFLIYILDWRLGFNECNHFLFILLTIYTTEILRVTALVI